MVFQGICAALWGLLTAAAMAAAVRFYLPVLAAQTETEKQPEPADKETASTEQTEPAARTETEKQPEPAEQTEPAASAEKEIAPAAVSDEITTSAPAAVSDEETAPTVMPDEKLLSSAAPDKEPAPEKKKKLPAPVKPYARKYLRTTKALAAVIALCALFAALCGWAAGYNAADLVSLLKMTLGMTVLSGVFFTDLELNRIPNLCSLVLLGGRVLTIAAEWIFIPDTAMAWMLNSLLALAAGFGLLYLMSRVTGGGLGMGDVKLFASLGFLCGVRAMCYTLLFSFFLCAVVSLGFILSKKKTMKDTLPMGPFIWAGFGLAVLLGTM